MGTFGQASTGRNELNPLSSQSQVKQACSLVCTRPCELNSEVVAEDLIADISEASAKAAIPPQERCR